MKSIDPSSGRAFAEIPVMPASGVTRALDAAVAAQRDWSRTSTGEREALLRKIAAAFLGQIDTLAPLITREMGKPIGEARAEIAKCATCFLFYADHAEEYLSPKPAETSAAESYVVLDPLGVILAIMPWNYPFWQLARFAAPALLAGNGIALKHASNVQLCAAAFERVLAEAGAPTGLMCNLPIEAAAVAGLIADDRIAAITLTGSTEVGSLVAAEAGRNLKKQVLELGGSDPFIVLADADIEEAARTGVKARFQNTGQSCIAAKRFILEDSIADAFVEAFCRIASALVVGDPSDPATTVGPMARDNLRDDLERQITRSVEAGAEVRLGGQRIEGDGYFFAPTVLDRVTPDMAVFHEETFGPVAAIVRVPDADAAVALANQTEFGLAAALWTRDIARAKTLVRRIEAGAVFVNGLVASDPRLPFGGIKRSGYGRELALDGLREFTNVKTVWIGPAKAPSAGSTQQGARP